ncbi:hypothetical protein [Gottschalkia acidurici]|nr:hypothetical protein [Gottschalkia acidurici]
MSETKGLWCGGGGRGIGSELLFFFLLLVVLFCICDGGFGKF